MTCFIRLKPFLSLVLLLSATFAQAQGSTSTSEDSAPKLATAAVITATPNPVPAGEGAGTAKISWQTGDNWDAKVYVSENGRPETLFGSGPDGSSEASWIGNGSTYVFRLYSTDDSRRLLATVEVKGTSEVAKTFNLTLLISKALTIRMMLPLLLFIILCSVAWYAARKDKRQLARGVLSANALLATAFTIVAVLAVEPLPFKNQPFPDAHEHADAAWQLVNGRGFVTYIYDNKPQPPRYPPGFALTLAPFAAINNNHPANIQTGTKIFAVLYVLVAVTAAWRIGGPIAAGLTALLIGLSPFARGAASLVMSDALGAAGTTLLIWLLYRPSILRISLAGMLTGALVAIRLPLAINLVALLVVLPGKLRMRALAFASPALGALGIYNWVIFGSPLSTGYSYWLPDLKSFAWSYAFASPPRGDGPWIVADTLHGLLMLWICPCPIGGPQAALPNIFFYPLVLLGFFWTFAPPLITIFGVFFLWRHRREMTASFTILVVGLSLVLFTFYFHQGTRFMAAPATLLIIFTSIHLAQWIEPHSKYGYCRDQ
jgi:hypothetical protein